MQKAKEPRKYTANEVKQLLVDFGNYLLSDKRAATIENEENKKVVTDADLANWKNEPSECDCENCPFSGICPHSDFERCENCEKRLPMDEMMHDREGVPICPECYEQIKDDPEFKVDPNKEEDGE